MARSQIHGSGKLVSLASRYDNVRQMNLEARAIDDRTTLDNINMSKTIIISPVLLPLKLVVLCLIRLFCQEQLGS
jgi:hypothetical protein